MELRTIQYKQDKFDVYFTPVFTEFQGRSFLTDVDLIAVEPTDNINNLMPELSDDAIRVIKLFTTDKLQSEERRKFMSQFTQAEISAMHVAQADENRAKGWSND